MEKTIYSGLKPHFILASKSKARQAILRQAGLECEVEAANLDEAMIKKHHAHLPPDLLALKLAEEKAKKISLAHENAIIIGADQILQFENQLWSKPKDLKALRAQLWKFRGKTHRLVSAVACYKNGVLEGNFIASAHLTMREFSSDFLDDYVEKYGDEACQSVGGYQIEGAGIGLFSHIAGDNFTIMGLPIIKLLALMRHKNWIEG